MSRETTDWQPIASAPRGRPLFQEDGPMLRVRWANGSEGRAYYGMGGPERLGPRWNDARYNLACQKPTHWRPDA